MHSIFLYILHQIPLFLISHLKAKQNQTITRKRPWSRSSGADRDMMLAITCRKDRQTDHDRHEGNVDICVHLCSRLSAQGGLQTCCSMVRCLTVQRWKAVPVSLWISMNSSSWVFGVLILVTFTKKREMPNFSSLFEQNSNSKLIQRMFGSAHWWDFS